MASPNSSLSALLAGTSSSEPHHYGGPAAAPQVDKHLIPILIDYLQRQGASQETWPGLIHNPHTLSAPSSGMAQYKWIYTGASIPFSERHERPANPMQCGFEELDAYRSDVASLARFSQRVDHATWYLCVAIDAPDNAASADRVERKRPRVTATRKGWYGRLANQCFARWRDTRDVLAATSSVPDASERFYRTAFWSLCELTPADSQLKRLFEEDRPRACRELVRHVDAYADQLALATDLAASLDADDGKDADPGDKAALASLQRALLDKAGDPLTLTQAADRLGISRQALHKKIKTHAALGLLFGETLVVPSAQLVDDASGVAIVAHLRKVLTLFSESGAGDWSALQYLIEPDPALGGKRPIDLLKAGDTPIVVAASRAFLGLDEG